MINVNFKYRFLFILLFVFINSALAQNFKFTADKTTVQQNDRFKIYFTFEGGNRTSMKNYRPPKLKNFSILSGPNQSSSMSIVNGSVSSTLTYSYIIVAPNLGEFTISPASLEFKGEIYKTNSLKIKVVKTKGSGNDKTNTQAMSNEELKENVFIRAISNKKNVVKGEQVTVTYKLYTKLNISSPQISKLPQYQGFWAKELETKNNIQFEIEMYKGVRYRSAILKKVALFPTKSGKLTVTPFELEIPVIIKRRTTRTNDPFDSFFNDSFFGRTETIQFLAISNKVLVNVAALPEEGKPESFAGAVGEFTFNASLDKNEVKANDAITLKIEVSGKGNIELIDLPEVKLPPGFEQYDPKTSKSIKSTGVISGRKTEEYLIVPRVPGIKEIASLKFSYYNPRLKKYIEHASQKFVIRVSQGDKEYTSSTNGFSKEDVKLLSQDIRFIQTSNFDLVKREKGSLIKSWFWGMLISPLLLMLISIGIKKRQDKLSGNVQLVKSRKAEKKAKLRLKDAQKALDENILEKYYEEVSKGLFGYLEDKLQLQKSESSIEKVSTLLDTSGVSSEVIKEVEEIIEKCEFSRFAPQAQNEEVATNLYNETVKVIVEIENLLNSKKKK